jgi:hypothetical protein
MVGALNTHENPYRAIDQKPFVARSVSANWNVAMGHVDGLQLSPRDIVTGGPDTRIVIAYLDSDLYRLLIELDPYLININRDEWRMVLPPMRITLAGTLGSRRWLPDGYTLLDMSDTERALYESRAEIDRLNAIGLELGIGRPDRNRIIREHQGKRDWSACETALRQFVDDRDAKARERQARLTALLEGRTDYAHAAASVRRTRKRIPGISRTPQSGGTTYD